MTTTKKIIVRLACATVLGTAGVALTQVNRPQTAVVNAATTSVAARALGVDVASYPIVTLRHQVKFQRLYQII